MTSTPLQYAGPQEQPQPGPPRPSYWQVNPEEYLGSDQEGRHYWLLNRNVFRTTKTGDQDQSTSWVSCETPFRTLEMKVNNVSPPEA